MKSFKALFLAAAVSLSLVWGGGTTPVSAESRVSDSVGMLYKRTSSNALRFTCTVSAIGKRELLTADHCVGDEEKFLVTFDGVRFISAQAHRVPKPRTRGLYVDIAILLAEQDLPVPALSIGRSTKIEEGSEVVTVGFPLGIAKTFYKGSFSGRIVNPGKSYDGYLILQIFGSPGSSGSPVLEKGTSRVVGVLVAAPTGRIGTPVIFAVPIEYEKHLILWDEKVKAEERSRGYE